MKHIFIALLFINGKITEKEADLLTKKLGSQAVINWQGVILTVEKVLKRKI